MASSLSALAENLITPDLSKFHETVKVIDSVDTRTAGSWDRLLEMRSPQMFNFYSTSTESDVSIDDYQHAEKIYSHISEVRH